MRWSVSTSRRFWTGAAPIATGGILTEPASYDRLIDLLEDGVALLDAQGAIVRANDAMVRILGYSPDIDLTGVLLLQDLNVGPVPTGEIFERLDRAGEIRHIETELMRRDGTRAVVLLSARALLSADRWPVAYEAICTDITERRSLERRWQRHERLVTAGAAAAGLAVDLQQLVTATLGYCDLLTNLVDDRRACTDLTELRETANTVATLARQLLAFTRPRVLHPVRIEVNATIEGLAPAIQQAIGDIVELRLRCGSGPAHVVVDPREFSEVLRGLASAAFDMTPGRLLTIRTDTAYLDATFSREHACVPPGHYAVVTVSTAAASDATLAATDWERERFFAPDLLGGDNGLALAATYAFAKHHGGHLTIRRDDRAGATFKIYLPLVPSAAPQQTILLVEDEPRVRCLARRLLEHLGYGVIEAPDAQEALWLAARHTGAIDVLLTDVVLPGMSAQELADRLHPSRPAMKILYMSGLQKGTLVERNALREDAAFIDKPFTIDEIARTLETLLSSDGA